MHFSKLISRPYFGSSGAPSSSDHHGAGDEVNTSGGTRTIANIILDRGAGDEVNTSGGTRTLANIILDRVRSVGLSGSIKFEAKKIKEGGKRNIFKQKFEVREGENLLKASHCCLSTEAGPVAGLLFISTERVAFCSQGLITFNSPDGLLNESDKKIEIPIRTIRGIDLSYSQQKKMTILTEDNSKFLFMDFLRYDKASQNLQAAILWQSLPS